MVRPDISKLLQKEMDRKDFLKHTGLAVLALTGVAAALKLFVDKPTQTSGPLDYGDSAYGGEPLARK
jgi:hypothetical protein